MARRETAQTLANEAEVMRYWCERKGLRAEKITKDYYVTDHLVFEDSGPYAHDITDVKVRKRQYADYWVSLTKLADLRRLANIGRMQAALLVYWQDRRELGWRRIGPAESFDTVMCPPTDGNGSEPCGVIQIPSFEIWFAPDLKLRMLYAV